MKPTFGDARPHLRVAGLGLILMLLMTVVVGLGVLSLTSVQREFDAFAEEDFPGFNHLLHLDRDLFRTQLALETAFLTTDQDIRDAAVIEYESLLELTEARWESYKVVAHQSAGELQLQVQYEHHRAQWLEATSKLSGLALDGRSASEPAVVEAIIDAEVHFAPTRSASHQLEEEFYEPLVEQGTDAGQFDARLLLLVLLAGGLLLGGIASLAAVRATKLQYVELRRRELNKRFRSLVESAQDVITVVSDGDKLTVMSGGLGALEPISKTSEPTHVGDLLRPAEYELWAQADERVLEDQAGQAIELETARRDGTVVYLEGHGSPMTDDPAQRVWVWRDITDRKELELQLSHQAFHDPLTGLANRALLINRAAHALDMSARNGTPISLLFCDLDEFKAVNDSLGHDQGDELLNVVAKRLGGCIRDSDTLARFGGDEFAILLEDADLEAATALAERILRVLPYEVVLDDRPVFPSISIGISTSAPGTTTDELLRNADLAMYGAKRSGKGRAQVFQEGMDEAAHELLGLQGDLKDAIQEQQFELEYQPTVGLSSGAVEGVEALIRWHHPTRGQVPPATFIPIAEATGSIIAIGKWVLAQACRTAADLQAGRSNPLLMHVNLSPQQLRDPMVVADVRRCLDESGLQPQSLVLEVTEGFLLDDNTAVERLHELHALGVQIAIDDFGTGYASISYLQQLPIDIIKIDRSFVSGDALAPSERRAFLQAIIGLAKSLNLRSVAEGIEHPHQLEELRELGCDTGQGYLWAPASGSGELAATIDHIDAGRNGAALTTTGARRGPVDSDPT